MAVISVNLTDTFEQWRTKTNTLCTQQGDLTTLTTTAKNTMVAAINEIDGTATEVLSDTTPQLGGNLDVLARIITTSTTNGNIAITPHGSGKVVLDGISHPNADGSNGQVLQTNGSGVLSFATISSDPTMGGDLSGTASNAQIVANSVTTTELATNAILAANITDGEVSRNKIAGDAIDGTKLADDACNSEHYTDGSIDTAHLANGAVTTNTINANAITETKLSGHATIDGSRAVGTNHIKDDAVTNAKVADNGLSGNKIHGGSISNFASTGIDDNADALAMTIDSSENVGIGTTGPSQRFHINASGGSTSIRIENSNADFLIQAGSVGGGGVAFYDWDNSAYRLFIKNNGNVSIGNTTASEKLHVTGNILASGNITAYSDERLKTNVQELDNTLNAIQNIRGVSYTRLDTKDNSIGVMAQDVETMFPELICESDDGMKSVNYNGLVGVLFSAVKELSATVKQLKERNN